MCQWAPSQFFVAMCYNEMLERVIHAQRQEHPLC